MLYSTNVALGPTACQTLGWMPIIVMDLLLGRRRGRQPNKSRPSGLYGIFFPPLCSQLAPADLLGLGMDGVTLELGKVIQQGWQSKGLTQKDLATKINKKPQVIADYESGRAIPNNQVLGKIERAIGLKLRGKDIGKPIEKGPRAK
ncbi:unnamed protein product [Nyctereutes procyonoides]|uniref:Endothelial differentiation-related factor 1 n=1 Tax=Nyctereutes procyonoides TaxID=34880 RepID=A0A811ZCV5_NYCPR|nr:unnamed protein product [Nyctereutes procyonoides]